MSTAPCPKSDEGVRSAVKSGAIVVPLGKSVQPVADAVRDAIGRHAKAGDDWEYTKVLHLIVVVECTSNGDCCEAGTKFMRAVRGSDGYGTYSDIIGRRCAVLAIGKLGKTAGAGKVEEVLLKRGGCKSLVKIGRADPGASLPGPWLENVMKELEVDFPENAAAVPAEAAPAAEAAVPPKGPSVPLPAAAKPAEIDPATSSNGTLAWGSTATLIGAGLVALAALAYVRVRR